jgi:hypothetical protein
MDDLDGVILFSGTWIWAAHLVAALRDFALTGKVLCCGPIRARRAGDLLAVWCCTAP